MSRRPGLGYEYFYNHIDELCENGYVTLPNGGKAPVPKYYWRLLADEGVDAYVEHQAEERRRAAELVEDTPEVRDARAATLRARTALESPNLLAHADERKHWHDWVPEHPLAIQGRNRRGDKSWKTNSESSWKRWAAM
jgi:hypothetical protein